MCFNRRRIDKQKIKEDEPGKESGGKADKKRGSLSKMERQPPQSVPQSSQPTAHLLEGVPTADLLSELKRRYSALSKPEKRLIFLGAPGSGKGTQSAVVKEKYNVCHMSSGDMLREAVAAGTDLGKQAKAVMERGELVSDQLVLGLIREKMRSPACKRGFILDGFPRSKVQAEMLSEAFKEDGVSLDAVVYFEAPDSVLTTRVCGRRVHPSSGRVYHVEFNPPKVEGIDDVSGEPLIHRKDDNEETLKKRLEVFHRDTMPLVEYYTKLGVMYRLDASQPTKTVTENLLQLLGPVQPPADFLA